jgi:hypothetical protein
VPQSVAIRFSHRAAEAIEITVPPRLLAIADEVIDQTTPGAVGLTVKREHDPRSRCLNVVHIEQSDSERF